MKILILIFVFYINYCTSQYVNEKKSITAFPKKVRAGLVQYNNAGKYSKPIKTKITRKPNHSRSYTVFGKPFPVSDEIRVDHQIVPDSPYFPVDEPEPHERRSRVKKVLPEEFSSHRHKRSADVAEVPTSVSASIPANTDTEPVVKKTKAATQKGDAVGEGTKKVKSSAKTGSKSKAPARLRGNKRQTRLGKKKRPLKAGAKAVQRQSLKQKLTRPAQGRSKKILKSPGQNVGPSGSTLKKLKIARSQHRVRKPRGKKGRKQISRNGTTKLRATRNPKGPGSRRLIAARDAIIEEYPYTVSIQKDGDHWCAGAILNPRLIITTANCLWRANSISRMRVRVGSRHADRGGQVAKIQEVMKHPGWKLRKNPDNDVALALLDRNIKFSHGLHGVDLPNRVMWPPFDDVWITSWGSERKDGIYDPQATQNLQVYHARLMEREKCNNITIRFGVAVTENFICLSQMGRRAPCTRDTGAPAVSDGVLWGLASWGIRKLCGTERFPAVFSYLASQSNMDFIANATHYLMSDERHYPFPDRYPLRKYSLTPSPPPTFPY